jgi:N-acetylglutamate synthase-like GNAT family acetyltransferase
MSLIIRQAAVEDFASIHKLLTTAGVSTTGLGDHITHYLVVENPNENKIAGTVGLEIYQEDERLYGLMRSLVLENATVQAKIGMELLRLFFAYAETKSLAALYLFTKSTGTDLFIHMGFSTVQADALPACIRQSPSVLATTQQDVVAMGHVYKSTTYPHAPVDIVDK